MSFFRFIVSGLCLLSLAACQFHLRGHQYSLGAQFPRIVLTSDLVNSPMSHTLLHTLKAAGVELVDEGAPTLHLSEYGESSTPLAYGVEGEVRRERFEGKMTLELKREGDEGEIVLPATTFTAIRDQLRYTDYDLATTSEKEYLLVELRQDLATQLILKLSLSAMLTSSGDEALEEVPSEPSDVHDAILD